MIPQCQCDVETCELPLEVLTWEEVEELNKLYTTPTHDAYVILVGHECNKDEVVVKADNYLVVRTLK